MQAQSGAQAVAVDNLSGQTTNQIANASASANAVATSITPLPRTFLEQGACICIDEDLYAWVVRDG